MWPAGISFIVDPDYKTNGSLVMAEKIWAALSNELADAAATVGKSVVAVLAGRHPGSGIVWTSDSVVTANHVVRRDEEIAVITSAGQEVVARVMGRDASTDLAVLRLQNPVEAQAPRWGDASRLRIGELVLALGRTRRGNIVASSGIVSGLMGPWRTWRGGRLDQFIRPDLTLYSGFSGGPLVNAQGEVLGLNTAGLHRSGITVPAATVKRVATELLEKGQIERPYLGLAMQVVPLPESLRTKLNLIAHEGLLVAHVEPASPAENAGILLGDVLVELDGQSALDTGAVQEILSAHRVGEIIPAKLVRAGAIKDAQITLQARPRR